MLEEGTRYLGFFAEYGYPKYSGKEERIEATIMIAVDTDDYDIHEDLRPLWNEAIDRMKENYDMILLSLSGKPEYGCTLEE